MKHFRGRDVHSPFMYDIVRKALMNRRGKQLIVNNSLYDFLNEKGYGEGSKLRICRIFAYLELERFILLSDDMLSESELIIIDCNRCFEHVNNCIENARKSDSLVCMVIRSIYSDVEAKKLWGDIINMSNCVSVDMYYEGIIFVNENLVKQNYKMKF